MTAQEEFNEALSRMVKAASDCVSAIARSIQEQISSVDWASLLGYSMPYRIARIYHPEWVKRAEHHKKKRVRNKYHNMIMKHYGKEI